MRHAGFPLGILLSWCMSTESLLALHLPRAAKVLPQFAAQFDSNSSLPRAARVGNIFRMLSQVEKLEAEFGDSIDAMRAWRRFDFPLPSWLDPETRDILENVESLGVLGCIGKGMVDHAI